jgi:hypothetical protein
MRRSSRICVDRIYFGAKNSFSLFPLARLLRHLIGFTPSLPELDRSIIAGDGRSSKPQALPGSAE